MKPLSSELKRSPGPFKLVADKTGENVDIVAANGYQVANLVVDHDSIDPCLAWGDAHLLSVSAEMFEFCNRIASAEIADPWMRMQARRLIGKVRGR